MNKKFLTRTDLSQEIAVVVGTRPGIIMLAPVITALIEINAPHYILHTGQHYSPALDSELFEDLQLPKPAFHLKGVSEKTTHGGQTAIMLEGCETAFMERPPGLLLVNGDANTNLAAALAARKLHIPVGHIEAGERSFDWHMPEEHNRRIMDHISDLLFASSLKAAKQLQKEDVLGRIHVTGNTIVDASIKHAKLSNGRNILFSKYSISKDNYILATSHREENVDNKNRLSSIIDGIALASEKLCIPSLFMAHPRTINRIREFALYTKIYDNKNIILSDSIRYLDFLFLLRNSRLVMTDSGGVQQEAYIHRRPTVTMRDNTEWTETLTSGANRLSGADNANFIAQKAIEANASSIDNWPLIFGDGEASKRIAQIAIEFVRNS